MIYDNGRLLNKRGKVVGWDDGRGYTKVTGNKYAHRIIWEMHHGPIPEGMDIDHINRDKSDNRIENLRIVNRSENNWNTDTSVGYSVIKDGRKKKYKVSIRKHYKQIHVGTFYTPEEAQEAYLEAKERYHA